MFTLYVYLHYECAKMSHLSGQEVTPFHVYCAALLALLCSLTFIYICPSGAASIPIFLPLTVLLLICVSRSPEASLFQWPPPLPSSEQLWDPLAPVLLLGWFALHAVIYLMPLGKV